MIDTVFKYIKDYKSFFIPVLVLIATIYAIDFLKFVLFLIQVSCAVMVMVYIGSIVGGFIFSLITKQSIVDNVKRLRVARIVKPLMWGIDLAQWLMQEVKDD